MNDSADTCPFCSQPVTPDMARCQNCGHRLAQREPGLPKAPSSPTPSDAPRSASLRAQLLRAPTPPEKGRRGRGGDQQGTSSDVPSGGSGADSTPPLGVTQPPAGAAASAPTGTGGAMQGDAMQGGAVQGGAGAAVPMSAAARRAAVKAENALRKAGVEAEKARRKAAVKAAEAERKQAARAAKEAARAAQIAAKGARQEAARAAKEAEQQAARDAARAEAVAAKVAEAERLVREEEMARQEAARAALVAQERAAQERAAQERAAEERAAQERAARERAEQEQIAARDAAAAREAAAARDEAAAREAAAAQEAAARAEAARVEAERAEAERVEAARVEAERAKAAAAANDVLAARAAREEAAARAVREREAAEKDRADRATKRGMTTTSSSSASSTSGLGLFGSRSKAAARSAGESDDAGGRALQPTEVAADVTGEAVPNAAGRWAMIGAAVAVTLVLGVVAAQMVMPSDDTSGIEDSRGSLPTTPPTQPETTLATTTTSSTTTTVYVDPLVAATERLDALVAESRPKIANVQQQWVLTLGAGFDGYVNDEGDAVGPVELVELIDELTAAGASVMVVQADDWLWNQAVVEGAYYVISAEGWWYPREADAWAAQYGITVFDYRIIDGEL